MQRAGQNNMETEKYCWYKSKVPTKQWNTFYSHSGNYTFLGEDGNDTLVGFLAVIPPDGCLEITNMDELIRIDAHRKASNHRPLVFQEA